MTTFVSQAKLDANRANAQKSTGPVSEKGKIASSMNGMKLGFTGRFILLKNESREDFDKLRERLREEHKPATDTERILVENMAKHHWLMNRALLEQSICMEFTADEVADKHLALMIRYQTTQERAFRSNLNQFLKLRKEREAREIGFASQNAKLDSLQRKAEAEQLNIQILRARVEKVQRPLKPAPAPQTPEIPVLTAPEIIPQPDPNADLVIEKGALAAA